MTTEDPEQRETRESAGGRASAEASGHEPLPEGEEAPPRGVRVMGIVRWALVVLMALVAFAAFAQTSGWFKGDQGGASAAKDRYYCPMHPSVVQDRPGDCPICSMSLVKQEGRPGAKSVGGMPPGATAPAASGGRDGSAPDAGAYYCPMHPEETSNDPSARCPKCGMKLEPRPDAGAKAPGGGAGDMAGMPGMNMPAGAGDGGAAGAATAVPDLAPIDLSPERIQLMGMKTARINREVLSPDLRTVGFVAASEAGLAQIQTRFTGWVEELMVSRTGEKVAKGQVLATVYSPEILTAQQEYLNALRWSRARGDGAAAPGTDHVPPPPDLGEDARRRLELLGISRPEIEEIERTGKPVRAVKIRSLVGGYVTQRNVVQGIQVSPGTPLFEVADLSTVWVLADVYEHEVGRVKLGQKAVLTLAAYPGEKFSGRLAFVYPSIDPQTRTLRVRLEFRNPKLKLRPGMYGEVVIEIGREEGLVAPAEAVVDTGEVQYLFVAQPGGRFEPRRVMVGARADDKVEVLSGVSEGETVVTTANFLVDSESRLRAAIDKQVESPTPAGGAAPASGPASTCDAELDKAKFPDKHRQCRACEVQHRGMGTMEEDCKKAIPKPWR